MADLPKTQYAVQLVGPDELILNKSKEVPVPGPYQILCRVEAVGLCFSDLKLLKQFSSHVRKSEVVSGVDLDILKEIPSYVPGEAATVPGHEAVGRVEADGPGLLEEITDFFTRELLRHRTLPPEKSIAALHRLRIALADCHHNHFANALQQDFYRQNRDAPLQ